MGAQGRRFFEQASQMGGLLARMRLASIAQVTSTEAADAEDAPELLTRLERALQQLRAETEHPDTRRFESPHAAPTGEGDARSLRRHLATLVELTTQRGLFLGEITPTLRRIDEAASFALDVARVSVWFLDDARSKITCADLFVRSTREHASGVELLARDHQSYFEALKTERTIAAHDARRDPRTASFSESYLGPLGITSMLDVPIWLESDMVGVVCHEHVGPRRTWNSDEETFAYLMSSFVARALERSRAARP